MTATTPSTPAQTIAALTQRTRALNSNIRKRGANLTGPELFEIWEAIRELDRVNKYVNEYVERMG